MSELINANVKTGFVRFTFTDEDGDMFASFKINPTDPRLEKRCRSISEYFGNLAKTAENKPGAEFEEIVEDKFCEFLGYDCRTSLFGQVAATDIMADGRMFASHILDTMMQKIGPEIQKRRRANIDRYAGKYEK